MPRIRDLRGSRKRGGGGGEGKQMEGGGRRDMHLFLSRFKQNNRILIHEERKGGGVKCKRENPLIFSFRISEPAFSHCAGFLPL